MCINIHIYMYVYIFAKLRVIKTIAIICTTIETVLFLLGNCL